MKTAVYTVNFGNYDTIKDVRPEPGFDYYLFTNDRTLKGQNKIKFWNIVYIDAPDSDNRKIKFCSHRYLGTYSEVIYLDASYEILSITTLSQQYRGKPMFLRHPARNCVYEEAMRCAIRDKGVLVSRVMQYAAEGMPENFGLTQNGIFMRSHNKHQNQFFDKIWEETRLVGRDQVAMPYVIWRTKVEVHILPHELLKQVAKLHAHKKKLHSFTT